MPLPTPRSRWERITTAPVPLWVVGLIVILGLLVTTIYGSILIKANRHGALGDAARALAAIPGTIQGAAESAFTRPALNGLPPLPAGLTRAPRFTDPGYVLVTAYSEEHGRRVIRLIRLADGALIREYAPDLTAAHARSRVRSAIVDLARDKNAGRYFPMHPLLMEDGGLILHDTSPLVRTDACGRVRWMIDGIFHHAVERAPDGTLWAAMRATRSSRPGTSPLFADESLAHVSPDGRLLSTTSVIDLLDRNGLGHLWRGRPYDDDPIHLNDIQPVTTSGPYWQRGDLFLSLRNLSMLLLYRPATGRILWHREEPWRFQHDVSILDDHRISVFDNNWRHAWDQTEQAEVDGTNRILINDFATGAVSDPLGPALRREHIATRTQGRATPLPGGDMMVEETEQGRLLRLAPDGAVRWRYVSGDSDGRRYALRWSRYLDPSADRLGLHAAETARCS